MEGRAMDGASIGGTSGGTNGSQGMSLDPKTMQMFQVFSMYMQQQQVEQRKEALTTKTL